MSVQRIASRYAKSLLDLAQEGNKLERVKRDVDTFRTITKNRDFYLFLKNPVIPADKKTKVVKRLFEKSYDELTLAFLNILIRKGREPYLPEIADEFYMQYKQVKSITSITLTSATRLKEETITAIHRKLVSSSRTNENIDITVKVDPKLIGGFIVETEGMVFDSSVAQKLEQKRREFRDNLYVSQVSRR